MMNKLYLLLTTILCTVFCAAPHVLHGQAVSFTHRTGLLNPVSGFTAYSDCAVDMNGDALDDVVRVGGKGLYIDYQQPDRTFLQVFIPMPVQAPPVWSVCAGDLDNNGFNDLLFADTETISFLLANQDGTSYSETLMPSIGVRLISQRSTIADINNDGWLDAFVANDTSLSIPYRNTGFGIMIPDTNLIHTSPLIGNYGAIWTDYDNDDDIDLYISKCKAGIPPGNLIRTNLLYRQNIDGSFSEVGASAGLDDNAQSWTTSFEDFDNDGDMDAFIINHDFHNKLLRNNGDGTFTDVIYASGIDTIGLDILENIAGDFNNDGFVDLFSELPNELYLGNGDLTFTGQDAPSPPGAIADLNDDGFLDVTKNGQVWLNDGNDENHWLKVVPFGLESNLNGIGARVAIYGDWGKQIREVRSGQGYSPMQSLTVFFGLGHNTQVDSLEIRWPSGIVTVLRDLHGDTTYFVPETNCTLPLATVQDLNIEICPGDTFVLEAPPGFPHYVWSNGDTAQATDIQEAGKYYGIVSDLQGCKALAVIADVTWLQDVPPVIEAFPSRRMCYGDSITLTVSSGENHIWSNGIQAQSIIVTETGNYTVSVDAQCASGQINSEPFSVELMPVPPPVVSDVEVSPDDSVQLTALCDNCYWYDHHASGELLHIGPTFETDAISSDTTFYVEDHIFYLGQIQSGGKSDTSAGGGLSLQTGFMLFEAWEPFTLRSVRVFLPEGGMEGQRFIQLFSPDTLLAFKQFQITEGWNTLELDFDIPVGKFSLHCPLGNLYRDIAPLNYPYLLGTVGQITTSSFGTGYYYYFYDWEIQQLDAECISERVPVHVIVTGTYNTPRGGRVEIFPNPTTGQITLRMEKTSRKGDLLRVIDTAGHLALQEHLPETHALSLEIGALPKGVYILQIFQNTQLIQHKIILL
jgi:hypothetical protein